MSVIFNFVGYFLLFACIVVFSAISILKPYSKMYLVIKSAVFRVNWYKHRGGILLPNVRYYKLPCQDDVLKVLTDKQKINLFGSNIFLLIKTFTIKSQIIRQCFIIVYDYDKNDYGEQIHKIKTIDNLIGIGVDAECLPTKNLKMQNIAQGDWVYGGRIRQRIGGKTRNLEVSKYFDTGQISRIEKCFIAE